jgi:galactose mutarotase-like enzyme
MITILLTAGIAASVDVIEDANAIKSKGTKTQKYGSATKNIVCGDRLCSEIEGTQEPKQEVKPAPVPKQEPKQEPVPTPAPKTTPQPVQKTQTQQDWQTSSGTITSSQDPGVGHETHQLAIILPPTSNVYKGILSYDASEPIQLVALHGPLGPNEVNGQAIWTPDGKTKFAMTFVDPQTSMGSWVFTGNALAVHTLHSDQFTVSYSVSYMEQETSDTVLTGTFESMQDPGIGHESHQLAIILPLSDSTYHGVLTYAASERIQLVALHGPLGDNDDNGQAIWTTDGKTKYGLTFVDNNDAMGTWVFSGNALAVHTLNEDQFTVSYSVVAGQ